MWASMVSGRSGNYSSGVNFTSHHTNGHLGSMAKEYGGGDRDGRQASAEHGAAQLTELLYQLEVHCFVLLSLLQPNHGDKMFLNKMAVEQWVAL